VSVRPCDQGAHRGLALVNRVDGSGVTRGGVDGKHREISEFQGLAVGSQAALRADRSDCSARAAHFLFFRGYASLDCVVLRCDRYGAACVASVPSSFGFTSCLRSHEALP